MVLPARGDERFLTSAEAARRQSLPERKVPLSPHELPDCKRPLCVDELIKVTDVKIVVVRLPCTNQRRCIIGRTAVNDDPFEVSKCLLPYAIVESRQGVRSIIGWRKDGEEDRHIALLSSSLHNVVSL